MPSEQDIVERLRNTLEQGGCTVMVAYGTVEEAADEIERDAARIAELEQAMNVRYWENIRDDNTRLRAEVERLRGIEETVSEWIENSSHAKAVAELIYDIKHRSPLTTEPTDAE